MRVLISGYYGYDNFGDELILSVLTDYLLRINADITVLSNNPIKTSSQYGIKSVKNFKIIKVIKAISETEILISGGGSLLQDVTSMKSLLYYLFVIWCAKLFEKKVIIFAQGIGPLQRNFSKNLTLKVLSSCDLVTVRDSVSQKFLQDNGINAKLVSDPVWSFDLPIDKKDGAVGVQLRAFRSVDNSFLTNLAKQIVLNFGERKIELFVLQETLDYDICKHFEKILKDIYPQIQTEIVHSLSNNDIIVRISRLEYMIAMRFHAILAAMKTGVKPMAINYDAKVAKLAYDAFLPMISVSGAENFEPSFEKLKKLDTNTTLSFSQSQQFEWDLFNVILNQ